MTNMTNLKKQAELDRIREEREAWGMWSAFADATAGNPDPIFPVMTRSEFYEELAKGTDEQRRSLFDALFNPALRQAYRMLTGKGALAISREEPGLLYVSADDEIDMGPRPGGLKPDDNIQN